MRRTQAAFALIRRDGLNGSREFLANWNSGWNAFNLVGGKRDGEETFRDCCIREIEEELRLLVNVDYRIKESPSVRLEETKPSQRTGELTAYEFEGFIVELLDTQACIRLDIDPDCSWLTESQIRSRRAADGRAVSDTIETMLVECGWLIRVNGDRP